MSKDATPPPEPARAEASTSSAASNPAVVRKELYLHEVFRGFDVDSFDWAAFEGPYKGKQLPFRLNILSILACLSVEADIQVEHS